MEIGNVKILIKGKPGSGKSFIAKAIVNSFPMYREATIINVDDESFDPKSFFGNVIVHTCLDSLDESLFDQVITVEKPRR